MATPGAQIAGHVNETSFDPNNLTGQLFMKGKRENTTLMLIGGMNAISPTDSVEYECGQDFAVPDHNTLPERIEGDAAPAHSSVKRSPTKNVVEIIYERSRRLTPSGVRRSK